jgi:mRNA interferase MazF
LTRALPRSGDVWSVRFGEAESDEQGSGVRPAVVVGTDEFNETNPPVVLVVPITRSERRYPYRVVLKPGTTGLTGVSWAAVEHIRSISTRRLLSHLGYVGHSAMGEIDKRVQLLLCR